MMTAPEMSGKVRKYPEKFGNIRKNSGISGKPGNGGKIPAAP
jgi:hypothetical protein